MPRFLAASAIAAAMAAAGAAAAISLVQESTSPLDVWRLWFASCLLGIVTDSAPADWARGRLARRLPRREMIEGSTGLV